jgi:hypothetical protein
MHQNKENKAPNKDQIVVSDRIRKPFTLNAEDKRFSVVKWDTKQFKVSIQSLNDFPSLAEGDYLVGEWYKVKWGALLSQKSKAQVLFIGTEAECKKEEKELVSYQVNNNLKSKITYIIF